MSIYKLDQLEGGLVTLPSGQWRWYVIRLNSLPEGKCETQSLLFVNEQDGDGIMRSRVPSDLGTLDHKAIETFARNPDDRSVRGSNGWITILPPTEFDHSRMWTVRPGRGRMYRSDLAIEKSLGELSRGDVDAIASAAL